MAALITANLTLKPLLANHYEAVSRIYREGIATGNATLQTESPDWPTWDNSHLPHCRLVAFIEEEVAGWAALTPVSGRCVYRGVAEVSVYVGAQYRGWGVGKFLLQALIQESEANSLWTLQAGIFKENAASLALHRNSGFRVVGIREKIGQLHGVWRDVCLLERRSKVVGV
ncbi:phosphinothricin N-acetyltransferase [Adhaeribacter aerolatus]|uniref:Phosphinothricin N-acetyltransferase n=1 Tax=Adhaeribacter aerolatus TaxID=670289 RepID=A0A512B2P5_9BACT|nr:GNAT family N-acetyltransferase [Adhaeribacter aerolatus]GEO06245.1 phosphinothricin N-acetyltransferase [Adhaeribacter aerolatus]